MDRNTYIEFIKTIVGASLDTPFKDDNTTVVARHSLTRKWFGLIMELDGNTAVNLKCEPLESDFLRNIYRSVIPAYHMNKTHWNTVFLEGDVPDEEIYNMTLNSFKLTEKTINRKK